MEKAVVFGTGNYYKEKQESIEKRYEIVGFLDNSIKPGDRKCFNGKKIMHPSDGVEVWKHETIILASVKFVDMYLQLKTLGVKNEVIACVDMEPAYDPFEEMISEHKYSIFFDSTCVVIEGNGKRFEAKDKVGWENNVRALYSDIHPEIKMIKTLPIDPISRRYGREHGTPIDRYYIEKFLKDNIDLIHGDIAEFADDNYTRQFGHDINNSYVLHVNGWGENAIKANLVTGEGIRENMVDCLICTQVLQFIFDLDLAIANMYRILKPGGVALLTVHSIAQISLYDYRNWGEYWRFTDMSIRELVKKNCRDAGLIICSYGNVKACIASLYGLCQEDMEQTDLDYSDEQYPLLLGVAIKKGKA